jgi:nicotinate phosphoribosyltransferase
MNTLAQLYRPSLALLTDLYQLTMAYGYWKAGIAEKEAVFHLYFRKHPFNGGFTLACGLQQAIEYLQNLRFDGDDLAYLGSLTGADGEALFEKGFLDFLRDFEFSCDVDGVPEGTPVFPYEPLLRVTGPVWQAQIIETLLLTILNFQTLIATKAARVCQSARGESVLEFGARRAQGIDGSLSASRAAYIGGCSATSNVMAGKLFGIPVKGTHAHSWVMIFGDEEEAFQTYARALPNNCVFLVDTYDTLEGVRHAVKAGLWLRENGHKLLGIRLDSGDLSALSIEARRILDEAGFKDAAIVASNDLDEYLIRSLKDQGAQINVWGVGTRLATAYDQPALGGVYKLSAVREGGEWQPRLKLSEQTVKISNPGVLQVRRFRRPTSDAHAQQFFADAIFDTLHPPQNGWVIVDPTDPMLRWKIAPEMPHDDLLVPIFRQGACVYEAPSIHQVRDYARGQLESLSERVRRFENPQRYAVGLEEGLHHQKERMILQARGL